MMSNGPWTSVRSFQERSRNDLDRVQVAGAVQDVDAAEALLAQSPEGPLEVSVLPADDVTAEVPVGPLLVPLDGDRVRDIDHDRVDEDVVTLGQSDQRGAGLLLDVGGIDNGEQPPPKPGADDVVEHVERIGSGGLVVLVVGHQPAAEVAGEDFGGLEVGSGEGGLPAPRDADHDDESHGGNGDLLFRGRLSHRCPPSG